MEAKEVSYLFSLQNCRTIKAFKALPSLFICFALIFMLFLGSVFACPRAWAGETIIYYGTNPSLLSTDPFGIPNSLFITNSFNNNTVKVSSATVGGNVYGGLSNGVNNVSYNNVIISGTSFLSMGVAGGLSRFANATNNSVSINGGTVTQSVYGGLSDSGDAENNSVYINNGILLGDIYAGRSFSGNAINNSISISGKPNLAASVLYGGYDGNPAAPSDVFTGNTLNLYAFQGTVAGLQDFQNIKFVLPANVASGATILTVSGTAELLETPPGSNRTSIIELGIMGGGHMQQVGETYTLINAGTLNSNSGLNSTAQGLKGVSLLYNFKLAKTGNKLAATVSKVSLNPQTKAFSEARAASMAFVSQGADLVANNGVKSALKASQSLGAGHNSQQVSGQSSNPQESSNAQPDPEGAEANNPFNLVAFASSSASSSRYKTGSHVDVDGVSIVAGLAKRNSLGEGNLLFGLFVEAGKGSFNSHNNFSSLPNVESNGDTNYFGGGILLRYDFLSGFYGDASVRLGRVKTDFNSEDLQDFMNRGSSYHSSVMYSGAHAGLGYVWLINNAASLDINSKYLWTHQNSDIVTIHGDRFCFNSINSQRWRGAARFAYSIDEVLTPYIGAAYEYEFDGQVKGSLYNFKLDEPSLQGGSGIGEIGISLTPSGGSGMAKGFSLDLGL